jgi:hypothetical protein
MWHSIYTGPLAGDFSQGTSTVFPLLCHQFNLHYISKQGIFRLLKSTSVQDQVTLRPYTVVTGLGCRA